MGENKRKLVKKRGLAGSPLCRIRDYCSFVRPDTFRSESNQPSLHE